MNSLKKQMLACFPPFYNEDSNWYWVGDERIFGERILLRYHFNTGVIWGNNVKVRVSKMVSDKRGMTDSAIFGKYASNTEEVRALYAELVAEFGQDFVPAELETLWLDYVRVAHDIFDYKDSFRIQAPEDCPQKCEEHYEEYELFHSSADEKLNIKEEVYFKWLSSCLEGVEEHDITEVKYKVEDSETTLVGLNKLMKEVEGLERGQRKTKRLALMREFKKIVKAMPVKTSA